MQATSMVEHANMISVVCREVNTILGVNSLKAKLVLIIFG
jgi:hypothetical protein